MARHFIKILVHFFSLVISAGMLPAQQSDTLLYSISPPPGGRQEDALFGCSVAVNGGLMVVGAEHDDFPVRQSGVVRVFDTVTGALLHVIPNPSPDAFDRFGCSVSISGTRIVVGAVSDDVATGSAYVYELAGPSPTVPIATLKNPGTPAGVQFGWSVAISGLRVVVGAVCGNILATETGCAYVYDLAGADPTVPIATLKDPLATQNDYFGNSVAIFDTRVVVGAMFEDTGAFNTGTVYVYDLASATPTIPMVTLNNPAPAVGDCFGNAVAIFGPRVVVGTYQDDANASNAGTAYVYDLASAVPTVPVATLNNPFPEASDYFGCSVAISGARVVVGAYADDAFLNAEGTVFVYDLSSGTPSVPSTWIRNPAPTTGDGFGYSAAISGTHVVVGALWDNAGASDAGSAYIYDLASANPVIPAVTLNNPGRASEDNFGHAVAISGTRTIVGVPWDDTLGPGVGIAYVYDRASTTPTAPVATLNNPGPAALDSFGSSVAISGTRVVVGAYNDDTGAGNAGSAYVYDLANATPTVPVAILNNPSPATSDSFGNSVAISGTRIVVGAYLDDTGAANAGTAYVYNLASGSPTIPIATLNNPSPASADRFGGSVAISGTRVVVGAYNDTGLGKTGAAYVYDLASATPVVPVAILNNPNLGAYTSFGNSVSISGIRVVVAASQDDTGATDAGSVYVYDLASASPTVPMATLNNPSPAAGERFGYSTAISGTRVVVGALADSEGGDHAGSAYVYDLAGATPTVPVSLLKNPTPDAADQFGASVAIDGGLTAVGARKDDTVLFDKGFAYIFGPADADADGLRDVWEYFHFGTTTGHSALDDADRDGRNELLELAFDHDPLVPDIGSAPLIVDEGGYLTLTLTKRPGVTFLAQSACLFEETAFSEATTTVILDDATTLKVRDNFPISNGGQRFLRVKVTAYP
jgi:hypothetical protein